MAALFPHLWTLFYICLAIVVISSAVMSWQGRLFRYFDGKVKKFSMLSLEFAPDRCFLYFVFRQIGALKKDEAGKVRKAVRAQLYTDFIFMLGTYPGIALLCLAVTGKYQDCVHDIFYLLFWFQLVCWLLDIAENLYFLRQLRDPQLLSPWGYRAYVLMETLKWLPSGGGFLAATFFLLQH